jgi:hypothetical protein
MSELKLAPGWLSRDIANATRQANDWSAKSARRDEKPVSREDGKDQNTSSREVKAS